MSRRIGWRRWAGPFLAGVLGACAGEGGECPRCDTVVIAATGEPSALLPPLVGETVGRDISDQVYDRLLELRGGASPLEESAYEPRLAARWERVDSLTLRFVLRPGARWHDGRAVTAADVAFSFAAYVDTALGAPAGSALGDRVTVAAESDSVVTIRFAAPDPEQLYDATWHVRVIPKHVWETTPSAKWAEDTSLSRLVGSGPYRVVQWARGQSLRLERADTAADTPALRHVIWRFAGDQDAALNLVLSHEADLLEVIGDSARVARIEADSALRVVAYPAAVYGFLGFNLAGPRDSPLLDREVRRALFQATDRATAARAVFGPGGKAPRGPMSGILWIADDSIAVLPYDTATAGRSLDAGGWRRSGAVRRRGGRDLTIDILVPGTSVARRNLAQIIQEQWRQSGITATVTSVDFPVFQERLRTGRFQAFVGAWLDEPSARGLADQWTTRGIGALNYGRYRSAGFDSLFRQASSIRGDPAGARRSWREAMDTLNGDAPAIWLYTPTQMAAVARRLTGVEINPYSWLAGLRTWRVIEPR
ncbi:MAG: ABC transporter substrate-binding protein [Gemmatimonadales bacterium]